MFWLRVCTVCLIMAAANHLLGFVLELETVRWSCVACSGGGSVDDKVSWTYSGDTSSSVTLTVTMAEGATSVPDIPDGQYWKTDECYQSVQKLVLDGVTVIGNYAFNHLKNLQTIQAKTVENIGIGAFEGSRINSPGSFFPSLGWVGDRAFKDAELSEWTVVGEVYFGEESLAGSTIQSFDVSACTGDLGRGSLLKNCKFLTSYTGGSEQSIPSECFSGCEKLANVKFGANLNKIEWRAFAGSGITTVDLSVHASDSFTVGEGAFKDCQELQTVNCPTLTYLNKGLFSGCIKLSTITLGESLTYIGNNVFQGCSSWKIAFATSAVTERIGESAFEGSGVTEVDLTLHTSNFYAGAYAFKDCQELHTVHCQTVTYLDEGLFSGCIKLSTIDLSEALIEIRKEAFQGCSSLKNTLKISFDPSEIWRWVGDWAFEGTGITELDLSANTIPIVLGAYAFKDCKDLERIVWSKAEMTLGIGCFSGCGFVSLEIPATVTELTGRVFGNCKSLTSVTYLGHDQTTIDLFEGCDALKNVTVPDDYPYDHFGGFQVKKKGLSLGAKIGIGVGVAAFVIIVIVVVVVLFVTGKIGGRKRDSEAVDA